MNIVLDRAAFRAHIRRDPAAHSSSPNREVAMVPILSLWLPIVVATVLVFVASSVIHMLLKYHANDYRAVPGGEAAAADALRGLPPGQYVIPYAGGMKEMNEPEYIERVKRGPIAMITISKPSGSGGLGMGRSLVLWFLFALVVSVFAAYLAGRALPVGAEYKAVFRFAATAAFLAYGVGTWSESIWFARPWSVTAKNTFDAIIFASLTGGTFGWLWPDG
jgi:hypothetical protein